MFCNVVFLGSCKSSGGTGDGTNFATPDDVSSLSLWGLRKALEILETGYVYGDVLELRRYGRRISFPNTRNVSIFAKAVCFITLSLRGPARARRVLETEQISQHQMIIQLDLCGSFKELGRYLRQDKFVVNSKSLEGTGEG